ncbi:MAG: twin-arginine translocase TatA/TatE family subunit [Alphaproteobacteria bacterium]|nr:twin-arginine translocase TatA/TatE family subunit [Alphaproteobacteria bacterium]
MSLWHLLVVALVIFVFFGAGRLPRLMGDVAEGIKAFKKGMKDEKQDSSKSLPPADKQE